MNLFYNPEDLRLRAGWRLLFQLLIMYTLVMLTDIIFQKAMNTHFTMILTLGIATVLSVWFSIRFLDCKKVSSYGLKLNGIWYKEWVYGLLMGAGAMVFIFLFEKEFGWISITGYGWNRVSQTPYIIHIGAYIISLLFVGFYEEFMFRGYQITNLFEGLSNGEKNRNRAGLLAVAISSIIFGLMHAGNANATWLSTVNIIAAGVMLALPYVLTGRLAMSIGIHMTWNIFEGGIFGFAVSGMPFRYSILQTAHSGPTLWTGGFFGPEAGFAGVIGILLLIGIQLVYVKNMRRKINRNNGDFVVLNNVALSGNRRNNYSL